MRVLAIGGFGFIGSHVTRRLLDDGHEVKVLDSLPCAYSTDSHAALSVSVRMRQQILLHCAQIELGGPHEPARFARLLADFDPEVIIYLIGMPLASSAENHMTEARKSIFDLTAATIEALQHHGRVRRFVYISSSMVYGEFADEFVTEDTPTNPVNTYGALKLASETLVKTCIPNMGAEYTIIRPSAVYGPYDVHNRVVQVFCERAIRGLPITINVPDTYRLDFTYVGDLASGIATAASSPMAADRTFNLTRGEARSLGELADILKGHFPGLDLVRDIQELKTVPKRGTLSIANARDCFGYRPEFDLEKGIRVYLSVLRDQHALPEGPAWNQA